MSSRGREALAKALRNQQRQMEAVAASLPQFQIPVRDSPDKAPGWMFVTELFSTIQDAVYPWDPAVLRAVREFCPNAQPLTIRSVWKKSRAEGPPQYKIITRHGLAQKLDPTSIHIEPHRFTCSRPLHQSSAGVRTRIPDYIEVNWYDKEDRPDGYDLPGAYLPFDWEFFHALRRAFTDSEKGSALAKRLIDPSRIRREERERQLSAEAEYREKQIRDYYREEPSTPEWEAALAGHRKTPSAPVSISIPSHVRAAVNPQKLDKEILV